MRHTPEEGCGVVWLLSFRTQDGKVSEMFYTDFIFKYFIVDFVT